MNLLKRGFQLESKILIITKHFINQRKFMYKVARVNQSIMVDK